MRTILDTRNDKGMFSSTGFGEYNTKNDGYSTYDSGCVEHDVNMRRKLRQHRYERHIDMIEFYDYDESSYYDDGMDALQNKQYILHTY